jgi:hypothetical protein
MNQDIYMISTYPNRKCGVGTFAENLVESIKENVNSIKIAAIDKPSEKNHYTGFVRNDWIIDQFNPNSFEGVAYKICSEILNKGRKNESTVILQHEFGLDRRNARDEVGLGYNFVNASEIFKRAGIRTVSYLHTVEPNPQQNEKHRIKTLQRLAKNNDSLIVIADKAKEILTSPEFEYQVDPTKIEHIPHGTRNFLDGEGRDQTKSRYGLEGILVFATVGMKEYHKGLDRSIKSWGKFINNYVREEDRNKIVYIIGGGYHPNFIAKDDGKALKEFEQELENSVRTGNIKSTTTKNPQELGELAKNFDVIFLEPTDNPSYISEKIYTDFFKMENGGIYLYRNSDQISSGPVSDSIGSGRAIIASKFLYSNEMLSPPNQKSKKGIVGIGNPLAKGLLVDQGEREIINQTVKALNYLVFNQDARIRMEDMARKQGALMEWPVVGKRFIEHLDFLARMNFQKSGNDPILKSKENMK